MATLHWFEGFESDAACQYFQAETGRHRCSALTIEDGSALSDGALYASVPSPTDTRELEIFLGTDYTGGLTGSDGPYIIGFRYKWHDGLEINQSSSTIFAIRTSAGAQIIRVHLDGSNNFTILDSGGTVRATGSTGSARSSSWQYLELYWENSATGTATLYVDGTQDCTCSGFNFSGTANHIYLAASTSASSGGLEAEYDDIYLLKDASGGIGDRYGTGFTVCGYLSSVQSATDQGDTFTDGFGTWSRCFNRSILVGSDFIAGGAYDGTGGNWNGYTILNVGPMGGPKQKVGDIYYVDGSVTAPSDPLGVWSLESNLTDSSTTTYATGSAQTSASADAYLYVKGTTAPNSRAVAIEGVYGRLIGETDLSTTQHQAYALVNVYDASSSYNGTFYSLFRHYDGFAYYKPPDFGVMAWDDRVSHLNITSWSDVSCLGIALWGEAGSTNDRGMRIARVDFCVINSEGSEYVRYNPTSFELKLSKVSWWFQRTTGKGHTTMGPIVGNDTTVKSFDITIGTSYDKYDMIVDSYVPNSSQYWGIGFGATGNGAQTITCAGIVAQMAYVWATAAATYVNLDTTLAASGYHTSLIKINRGLDVSLAASGYFTSEIGAALSVDATIPGSGYLTPELNALRGIYTTLSASGYFDAEINNALSVDATIPGSGYFTEEMNVQRGLDTTLSASGYFTEEMNVQRGLNTTIPGSGYFTAEIGAALSVDATIPGSGYMDQEISINLGLNPTISASGYFDVAINNALGVNATIPGSGYLTPEMSIVINANATIPGSGYFTSDINALRGVDATIPGASTFTTEMGLVVGYDTTISGVGALISELNALRGMDTSLDGSSTITSLLNRQVSLDTIISAIGTIDAAISLSKDLSATIAGASAFAQELSVLRGFVSGLASVGTLDQAVSLTLSIDTTLDGLSALAANLDSQPGMASQLSAVSQILAEIATQATIELDSTIPGAATLAQAISLTQSIDSSISGTGSLDQEMNLQVGMTTIMSAIGSIISEMDVVTGGVTYVDLDGSFTGTSTFSVSLNVLRGLVNTLTASGTITSDLNALRSLVSDTTGTSTIVAELNAANNFDSIISAVASFAGELNTVVAVNGQVLSSSTVSGTANLLRSLDSQLDGTGTIDGNVNLSLGIDATVDGALSIFAEMTGEAPDLRGVMVIVDEAQYGSVIRDAAMYSAVVLDSAA